MGSALAPKVEKGLGGRRGAEGCTGHTQPAPWPLLSPSFPRSDYHRAVFCYGDTKGNVIVFTSNDVTHGLFNP